MIDEAFPEQPTGGALPAPSAIALPRARLALVAAAWDRVALAGTLLLAAYLNFYQLSREGYGNTYYAAGVRSMLESWHNFFFASFDPGGFVTIDKPPLGFWLQAASARLFGFHGWSLMLPAGLAGVLSVALLYHLVRNAFGPAAGALAALALAVTPVTVAADRSNIVDGILVMFVLLGAWAVLRAVETGRHPLRWLLAAMVFVGLGFNVKMLEAFLVVPALLLVYLVGSRLPWRTRVWHLALAAVVLMAVSLSWATAVDLTPASQRPYVGSSSNNSEYNLIFGYNGLQRLLGRRGSFFSLLRTITGTTEGANGAALGGPGGPGGAGETGATGWLRLFNQQLGGQTGWLLPLALIGILAVAWRRRPSLPLDARQRQLVLWGSWLLTGAVFFSVAGFFHTYYLVMLAPPIAALAGAGLASLWSDYRAGSWRGWLLPLSLAAVALAQWQLLKPYPGWSHWLSPTILALGIGAALVLVVAGLLPRLNVTRLPLLAATVGALALLLAPTVWAAETTLHGSGGMIPVAGPQAGRGGFGGFGGFNGGRGGRALIGQAPGGAGLPGQQTSNTLPLLRYLESQQGSTKFLVAVDNANTAGPIILETGKPVMALGGFTGSDPILTTDQLAELVKQGSVRFFLLAGGFGGFGGGFGGARTAGSAPPNGYGDFTRRGDRPADEQPPAGSELIAPPQGQTQGQGRGAAPAGFGGRGGNLMSWVTSQCTVVPASTWESNGSGLSNGFGGEQLYDCAGLAAAQAG